MPSFLDRHYKQAVAAVLAAAMTVGASTSAVFAQKAAADPVRQPTQTAMNTSGSGNPTRIAETAFFRAHDVAVAEKKIGVSIRIGQETGPVKQHGKDGVKASLNEYVANVLGTRDFALEYDIVDGKTLSFEVSLMGDRYVSSIQPELDGLMSKRAFEVEGGVIMSRAQAKNPARYLATSLPQPQSQPK